MPWPLQLQGLDPYLIRFPVAAPPSFPIMVHTAEAPTRTESPALHEPQAWRVEVFRRAEMPDPEGEHALAALSELGFPPLEALRTGRGTLLSPSYSRDVVEEIATAFLADPVVNEVRIYAPEEAPPSREGTHRVLVMPRPGVMDPVARTVEDLLARTAHLPSEGAPGVATFRIFEVHGSVAAEELARAARRVWANETI